MSNPTPTPGTWSRTPAIAVFLAANVSTEGNPAAGVEEALRLVLEGLPDADLKLLLNAPNYLAVQIMGTGAAETSVLFTKGFPVGGTVALVSLHAPALDRDCPRLRYLIAHELAHVADDFRAGAGYGERNDVEGEYRACLQTIAWGYARETLDDLHQLRAKVKAGGRPRTAPWAYCLGRYAELKQAAESRK